MADDRQCEDEYTQNIARACCDVFRQYADMHPVLHAHGKLTEVGCALASVVLGLTLRLMRTVIFEEIYRMSIYDSTTYVHLEIALSE